MNYLKLNNVGIDSGLCSSLPHFIEHFRDLSSVTKTDDRCDTLVLNRHDKHRYRLVLLDRLIGILRRRRSILSPISKVPQSTPVEHNLHLVSSDVEILSVQFLEHHPRHIFVGVHQRQDDD